MSWKSSKFKSKNKFKDFFPTLSLDSFRKKKPSINNIKKIKHSKKSNWFTKKKNPVGILGSKALETNYLHYLICIFSGLIAGWCLPSDDLGFVSVIKAILIWFALAPFFVILWQTRSLFSAAFKAALTGFCFNLIAFRFLFGIHPLDWLGIPDHLSLIGAISAVCYAALFQAFYWLIYGAIFKLLHKSLGIGIWSAFQASVIWVVLFEKIANSHFLKGLPLSSLYYSQHNNFYLLQSSDLIGAALISFLIIFSNIVFAHWIASLFRLSVFSDEGNSIPTFSLSVVLSLQCILLIGSSYLYGGYYYFSHQNLKTEPIKVALLQKNLGVSSTRILSSSTSKNLNGLIKLFKKRVQNKKYPDLIVVPEGSLREDSLAGLFKFINIADPSTSLIGGSYVNVVDVGDYNSAIGFNAPLIKQNKICSLSFNHNLQTKQIYFKQALVPFGEYVPFENFFKNILSKYGLEYLAESDFKAGNQSKAFEFNIGNFAPLICFEIFFPELANQQIKYGGDAFVLLGDTSWFHQSKNSIGALMLAAAKVRAVETRKDIIVNANQGPLALIDRFGRVKQEAKAKEEYLFGSINKNRELTMFSGSQI